ncbi:MAG: phage holin family protein [Bacteroidales bacterium]|nr:phage holin family protein [Bacteroidales bacterium]
MIEQIITTDWGERLRTLIQAVLLLVASFLSPLSNAFTVLIVMAVADVFGGMAGNVWTGREEFKFRKAFQAIYKIIAYCVMVLLVHFCISSLDAGSLAGTLVKFLTWTISYWYLSNILGNMCKAFPRSKGFLFLYLALSLKILPLMLHHMGLSKEGADDLTAMVNRVREPDDPVTKVTRTETTIITKTDDDSKQDRPGVAQQ